MCSNHAWWIQITSNGDQNEIDFWFVSSPIFLEHPTLLWCPFCCSVRYKIVGDAEQTSEDHITTSKTPFLTILCRWKTGALYLEVLSSEMSAALLTILYRRLLFFAYGFLVGLNSCTSRVFTISHCKIKDLGKIQNFRGENISMLLNIFISWMLYWIFQYLISAEQTSSVYIYIYIFMKE